MTEFLDRGIYSSEGVIAEDAEVRFVGQTGGMMSGKGPGDVAGYWSEWLSAWEKYTIFWDDIFERGDAVVMLVRLVGTTKHGGVEIEQPAAAVFRFEGEQVVDIEFTLDREGAIGE